MKITKADYLGNYRLLCHYDDGQKRLIDLENLFTTSECWAIKKYAPLDQFQTVRVDYGTLAWGDNECDISPYDIYDGQFEAADSPYLDDIRAALAEREAWQKAQRAKTAHKQKPSRKPATA